MLQIKYLISYNIFQLIWFGFVQFGNCIMMYLWSERWDFDMSEVILGWFFMAYPILRSDQLWLYRTADLDINFTVSFDPVDRFWHLKSPFGVVFQVKSNCKVTLHISWHGKYISITSDTVDGFQSLRGNLGVVFQGQSNDEVTVHISWHGKSISTGIYCSRMWVH